MVDHLLARFYEMPLENYDEAFIHLLVEMSSNCVEAHRNEIDSLVSHFRQDPTLSSMPFVVREHFGLHILWRCILSDVPIESIRLLALENLKLLLSAPMCRALLTIYTHMSIVLLRSNKAISTAFTMLSHILDVYDDDANRVIVELQSDFNILRVVLDGFLHHVHDAKLTILKQRLGFLRRILSIPSLLLSRYVLDTNVSITMTKPIPECSYHHHIVCRDQISLYWSTIIEMAPDSNHRDAGFEFLSQAGTSAFTTDSARYLLQQFDGLDLKELSMAGFQCLSNLFRIVNAAQVCGDG